MPEAVDIERWLSELGLQPGPRVEREGIVAWDLTLDGRVRRDLRATLILDPAIGAIVGEGPYDGAPNRQEPGRLNTGITVVGKQSIIPRGARVGRNVKIGGGVRNADYKSRVVKTGGSVDAQPARARSAASRAESEAASAS